MFFMYIKLSEAGINGEATLPYFSYLGVYMVHIVSNSLEAFRLPRNNENGVR